TPRSLALDSEHVYVGEGTGDVMSVPLAGGVAVRIGGRGEGIHALVMSGGGVLFSTIDEALLARAPAAGGATTILGRTPFHPSAIAARGNEVWVTGNIAGKIARLPAGRDRAEVVIDELDAPSSLFVDDTSVYVRELDGARVRRFPREGGR